MEEETEKNGVPRLAKRLKRKERPEAVRYHCDYCRKDISNIIRIKCAVCQDFDLCLQCFSVGVEIGSHKKNHDYQVMDILNFPLFDENWGADEELLLLEGIEMYGLGNWGDVADHVGTQPSEDCKQHYFETYLHSPYFPLPDMSKILTTAESLQQRNQSDDRFDFDLEDPKAKQAFLQNSNKTQTGKQKDTPYHKASHSIPEYAGWMPLRGDFETEYDNDAELLLCDLVINDDDTPSERDLKLNIIELYNQKLDERIRRKKFIVERGLFDSRKERKKFIEDKDIYDTIRSYGQLLSKEDHEKLLKGLINERRLRRRIEQLKEFRKMGITSNKEAEEYENDKKKRETEPRRPISDKPNLRTRWTNKEKEEKPPEPKKPKSKKLGSALDISNAPSCDLLSEKEKVLCSTLRLYPQQYIVIKDTLIRESLKVGHLKKGIARQLIKIDVNKTSKIFDFLESEQIINDHNLTTTTTTQNALPLFASPVSPIPST